MKKFPLQRDREFEPYFLFCYTKNVFTKEDIKREEKRRRCKYDR